MSNFLIGFLVGVVVTSGGWIAFMMYIANRTGGKVGE